MTTWYSSLLLAVLTSDTVFAVHCCSFANILEYHSVHLSVLFFFCVFISNLILFSFRVRKCMLAATIS